ncbi:peptide deformylase [Corynebacterium zhongnanshanii]|uniref:Peptide deformylase n=1 Tax=Corynebacterium zhongnanshanii TaxID=2768834 RepID=A0ABQ6VE70_9CORY|nr:peptide deformylase [Corynebacterium zhongnanshanii]KAB3519873.1 peptide deformylase [Corynebacterium zhongnanshanii]
MSIMPIVIAGDPVLHNPTEPVDLKPGQEPDEQLATLINDMYETMDRAHGVGLAANQVGVNKRFFVYNCPDIEGPEGTTLSQEQIDANGGPMRRGCVINPQLETSTIPETMPHDEDDDEGCLSVPGYSFPTGRANWARVTGLDEHGQEISIEGYGFFARCLQHEVGHLDGFLYTDMLIGRYKRQAKKAIKAEKWTSGGNTWTPGVDKDPFGHDDLDDVDSLSGLDDLDTTSQHE